MLILSLTRCWQANFFLSKRRYPAPLATPNPHQLRYNVLFSVVRVLPISLSYHLSTGHACPHRLMFPPKDLQETSIPVFYVDPVTLTGSLCYELNRFQSVTGL
ncbi:uncharacterized protein TEOVI_000264800 [Trypanosoma equiperdum]|uniref:Uncharacterized protein n=2 Tax=Trypanozoon TaxID=39700 RepID=Q4GYT2_TRYB2|nr:hypothetical protein, unlikely [Trypanosoma brucei brucei TREU927]CAJ16477.1 hypothetical protein, unlikely [Trypanosoma brucei brucei TREU927]SCU71068.1 hypothetical protein, conserved [Trypanosoma equiperdum]